MGGLAARMGPGRTCGLRRRRPPSRALTHTRDRPPHGRTRGQTPERHTALRPRGPSLPGWSGAAASGTNKTPLERPPRHSPGRRPQRLPQGARPRGPSRSRGSGWQVRLPAAAAVHPEPCPAAPAMGHSRGSGGRVTGECPPRLSGSPRREPGAGVRRRAPAVPPCRRLGRGKPPGPGPAPRRAPAPSRPWRRRAGPPCRCRTARGSASGSF